MSATLGQVHIFNRRARLLVVAIVPLLLLEAAARVIPALGTLYLLDRALPAGDAALLRVVFEALAVAFAVSFAAGFLRACAFARLQSRCLTVLRQSMFDRLQQLSMLFHSNADGDELIDQFTGNFAIVEDAIARAVQSGLLPMAECVLATGLMVWLDWRVGLIGLILWPWTILAPRAAAPRLETAAGEHRQAEAHVLGVVRENLDAQHVIRAFAIEHLGAAAFRRSNETVSQTLLKTRMLESVSERFTGTGILLEQLLVLLISGWFTFQHQMSLGTMASLQMLVAVLGRGLLSLVDYIPAAEEGREALELIRESLHEPDELLDRPDARRLPLLNTGIALDKVSFSYDGRTSALSGVTVNIRQGSYVAFVGPSGSGKSTILNLIMRFHDPQVGHVAFDGHDLRAVTQTSLREQLGIVLQEGFLFNTTLSENIRMGLPTASEAAILEAAKSAGLSDYIALLPQGLETPVGSTRHLLPPEAVQRVAIARAVLRKPAVLLLDEASSGLDPAAELSIAATVRELAKSATVVSATHRLATAADADHIFLMDHGVVAEQGTHYELMAKNGAYASLWQKQAGFRFSADGRHVDVDAQRLRRMPILEALDEEFLAELAPYFVTECFERGREIVRQNDPGDKFYIIARGVVDVVRVEEQSGDSLLVNTLHDGDFFGEITLITGFPRSATVRTATTCTCLSLERGQFNRLIERYPELKAKLSGIGVQRLRDSSKLAAAGKAAHLS